MCERGCEVVENHIVKFTTDKQNPVEDRHPHRKALNCQLFFKKSCVLSELRFCTYSACSKLLSSWLQHLNRATETGKVISSLSMCEPYLVCFVYFPPLAPAAFLNPPSVSKFSFYEGKQNTFSSPPVLTNNFPISFPAIIQMTGQEVQFPYYCYASSHHVSYRHKTIFGSKGNRRKKGRLCVCV